MKFTLVILLSALALQYRTSAALIVSNLGQESSLGSLPLADGGSYADLSDVSSCPLLRAMQQFRAGREVINVHRRSFLAMDQPQPLLNVKVTPMRSFIPECFSSSRSFVIPIRLPASS
ncbi:MAG: hypothetical protein M2R45_04908 [Verrucomicrobia subdivision 3 bacterium]|nr:hypothetical protein [Limisphaerales bacterium]MCS1417560.1 hypothetical protein [Limisphaerales bacterium]